MRLRLKSLRAPILMASILVFAGVGYAAYESSATLTVNASTASFSIVYTAITDPALPANIVTFSVSALPSAHASLVVAYLLGGQTIDVNYTVEDVGTIGATGVTEQIQEKTTNCDGTLVLAQVGVAPTTLAPMTPANGEISITDNAGSGPAPPGCSDPFSAVWWFNVTGSPV
jgi:archaellum component FlaF (FlaF/FlaG flagellin family)